MGKKVKRSIGNSVVIAVGALITGAMLFNLCLLPFTSLYALAATLALIYLTLYLGYGRDNEGLKTIPSAFLLLFTLAGGFAIATEGDLFLGFPDDKKAALAMAYMLLTVGSNIAVHAIMYFNKEDKTVRRVFAYFSTQGGLFFIGLVILINFFSGRKYYNLQENLFILSFCLRVIVQILVSLTPLNRSFSADEVHGGLRSASIFVNVLMMFMALYLISMAYGTPLRFLIIASLVLFGINIPWTIKKFPNLGYFYTALKYGVLAYVLFRSQGWSIKVFLVMAILLFATAIILFLNKKGIIKNLPKFRRLSGLFKGLGVENADGGITPGIGRYGRKDLPAYQLTTAQRYITPKMPSPPTNFGVKPKKSLRKEISDK